MLSWGGIIAAVYVSSLVLLALFGVHRYALLYLYLRNRPRRGGEARVSTGNPSVTVQLPIFNERYVADRLLEAVAAMRYPSDKIEIQVLDDSTDDTVDVLRAKVDELKNLGHDIHYIHRTNRTGFKAGALEAGLQEAQGEFIAVFDADFTPDPGFLERVVPQFQDEKVGMVQTRWSHINRDFSLLTQIQSILLDGHFVIEQTARNGSGRFFNFNGTAGMWRRQAIVDAGGWQADTLTEDLDLSYRAQLAGWQFVYLDDVESPAELPVEMNAYKSQQHRWAKGSIQTAKKLLPRIWASSHPLKVKLEATFHLTNNVAYLLMMVPVVLMLPMLILQSTNDVYRAILFHAVVFALSTLSVIVFYMFAERRALGSIRGLWMYLPCLMSVGIGMALNNTRAVLEGISRHESPFLRTPKYAVINQGSGWKKMKYRAQISFLTFLEIAFAIYFFVSITYAVSSGSYLAVPILGLFLFGFLYVGGLSLFQRS